MSANYIPLQLPGESDFDLLRDVPYGRGTVGASTAQAWQRTLTMDVYFPTSQEDAAPRPAIVMAFGGAFHRGCKEDDSFEAENQNTAVAEYCRRFAQAGYVAASIDYRLVTEDPDPGSTPVVLHPEKIPMSRVTHVRKLMGLPPATHELLWAGIEAASDDMACAISFIQQKASEWQIDPDRVVAGGFSAGARTALNAAIGEKAHLAGVISLSGYIDVCDLKAHAAGLQKKPAVLLINGFQDLDYIVDSIPALTACLEALQWPYQHAKVLDMGHFYPCTAPVSGPGIPPGLTVEQTVLRFLEAIL